LYQEAVEAILNSSNKVIFLEEVDDCGTTIVTQKVNADNDDMFTVNRKKVFGKSDAKLLRA
jgi:hypothetical protein